MSQPKVTVHLDTNLKYRNASEYRPINRARSGDLEVVGDGAILKKILKLRYEHGAPLDAIVEVFRGETLCFNRTTLKAWIIPGESAVRLSKKRTVPSTN